MKALLQRVSGASVHTSAGRIAAIEEGVLAFVACVKSDSTACAEQLAGRLVRWQIFDDSRGRIGESLLDRAGSELLVVPQFTLAAAGDKGGRADFADAMPAAAAEVLFAQFVAALQGQLNRPVASGQFGAQMSVRLTNEGPVTFLLEQSG